MKSGCKGCFTHGRAVDTEIADNCAGMSALILQNLISDLKGEKQTKKAAKAAAIAAEASDDNTTAKWVQCEKCNKWRKVIAQPSSLSTGLLAHRIWWASDVLNVHSCRAT